MTFATLAPTTVYYNATSYASGQVVDFAQQVNAGSLAPGNYNWTMTVTEEYANASTDITRTYTGSYDVQNLDQSAFGAGWMLQSLDQLYVGAGGIELGDGNGDMFRFAQDPNNANNFLRPDGEPGYSTLVKNGDGTYTLTDKHGNIEDFAASGLLTAKIDSNGNKTNFTFSGGLIQTITDPAGRTTQFSYTGGLATSVTDIYGRTTTYGYTNGQLTSVTGPDPGNGEARLTTTFAYDTNTGEETSSTDATGTTNYSYDAYGALTKIVTPDGDATAYSAPQDQALPEPGTGGGPSNLAPLVYDSSVVGTQTDPNGQGSGKSTTYTAGIFGLVTRSTDPTGATSTTVYNNEGEPLEIDGPMLTSGPYANLPNKTTFSYDSSGNLVKKVLPDGSTESWTFDSKWNEPLSHTDPAGRVTTWTLDPSTGNVLSMTEVGVNSPSRPTTYTYTTSGPAGSPPAGLLASVVDPRGIKTQYSYTSHGLVSAITYAVGTTEQASVSFGYSSSDDLVSETDELNRTTAFKVDGVGRTIETDAPPPDSSQPTVYPKTNDVYDALGRLITETVLQSVQPTTVALVTSYSYNADGQVTRIQQPDPTGGTNYTVTQNFYDPNGNLIRQVSPSGRVTAWEFDADNRRIAEQDPSPTDGSNNLSFNRATANGPVTTVAYDPLGNAVAEINANGQETDNVFDLLGDLLSTTGPADANNQRPTIQYSYNADQEMTGETNALLGVTRLAYDDFGELIQRQDPSPDGGKTPGPISTWKFDGDGNRVLAVDANGNEKELLYNYRNILDEAIAQAPSGGPVWQWRVDPAGQVTETIDPMQRVSQFVFNGDGQLIQSIAPNLSTGGPGDASTTTTDTYDLAGDKISETAPLPSGAAGSTTTTWQYDQLGQVTQETQPAPAPGQSAIRLAVFLQPRPRVDQNHRSPWAQSNDHLRRVGPAGEPELIYRCGHKLVL